MKGQTFPAKNKREIYQLTTGKANGFIEMDTMSGCSASGFVLCQLCAKSRESFDRG